MLMLNCEAAGEKSDLSRPRQLGPGLDQTWVKEQVGLSVLH